MKFDIARQPLIPAFLTLFVLAAVAMWGAAKRPAAMPQSYSERIAAYTRAAATPLETADRPDRPAYGPTDPTSKTQPQTTGKADGIACNRLATPADTQITRTLPAVPDHAAAPDHDSENREATYPDQTTAATDTAAIGDDGEALPAAAIHPASPATVTDSATHTAGENTTAADSTAAADHTTVAAETETTTAEETTPGEDPATAETLAEEPHDRMAIRFPGEWLADFEANHPGGARWIGGLLILFAGLCIGRLTARNNLYSVGTCLAIPLYGILLCGIGDGAFLSSCAAPALLALATKNYARSFRNGFGFDAIFRASLYLGLLPLVATAAAPLLILLPLAVMLFRRTLREVAVAVAGLLLPALTLCYVNWAAGGEFLAQVAEPGSAFIAGTPLSLFLSTPVQNLVLPGAVFLLDLTALLFFLSDIYALGTKPRLIFIFNISALLLTAAALCGPAATPATVALAAVPSAVLLPFMFVRIHRAIALPLYLLLLASAVISAVLQ